jgi:hypothetical protein
MRSKTAIALSTAIFLSVLGASSMALAGDRDDADYSGGYSVGPQGQLLGTPNATGRNAYGFVPAVHSKQLVHKKAGNTEGRNAFGSAPSNGNTGTDANIAIQDRFWSESQGY